MPENEASASLIQSIDILGLQFAYERAIDDKEWAKATEAMTELVRVFTGK